MSHFLVKHKHRLPQASPWFLWLNLLSLDATLVALCWQEVLARAAGASLFPSERVSLGLAVWMIYTLDHLLDSSRRNPSSSYAEEGDFSDALQAAQKLYSSSAPRHLFARRHRWPLVASLLISAVAGCVAASQLTLAVFLIGIFIGILSLLYLGVNACLLSRGFWPHGREAIIALLFALGTAAVPLLRCHDLPPLLGLVFLFALLCYADCRLVARLETDTDPWTKQSIPPPPWLASAALIALFLAFSQHLSPPNLALILGVTGLASVPSVTRFLGADCGVLAADGALLLGALLSLLF